MAISVSNGLLSLALMMHKNELRNPFVVIFLLRRTTTFRSTSTYAISNNFIRLLFPFSSSPKWSIFYHVTNRWNQPTIGVHSTVKNVAKQMYSSFG